MSSQHTPRKLTKRTIVQCTSLSDHDIASARAHPPSAYRYEHPLPPRSLSDPPPSTAPPRRTFSLSFRKRKNKHFVDNPLPQDNDNVWLPPLKFGSPVFDGHLPPSLTQHSPSTPSAAASPQITNPLPDAYKSSWTLPEQHSTFDLDWDPNFDLDHLPSTPDSPHRSNHVNPLTQFISTPKPKFTIGGGEEDDDYDRDSRAHHSHSGESSTSPLTSSPEEVGSEEWIAQHASHLRRPPLIRRHATRESVHQTRRWTLSMALLDERITDEMLIKLLEKSVAAITAESGTTTDDMTTLTSITITKSRTIAEDYRLRPLPPLPPPSRDGPNTNSHTQRRISISPHAHTRHSHSHPHNHVYPPIHHSSFRRALLAVRELIRTERSYLASLRLLLSYPPHHTHHNRSHSYDYHHPSDLPPPFRPNSLYPQHPLLDLQPTQPIGPEKLNTRTNTSSSTRHIPPPLMRAYAVELVKVSEALVRRMERDLCMKGVARAFVGMCGDEIATVEGSDEYSDEYGDEYAPLETAYVAWCGVVGSWFVDGEDEGGNRSGRAGRRLSKPKLPSLIRDKSRERDRGGEKDRGPPSASVVGSGFPLGGGNGMSSRNASSVHVSTSTTPGSSTEGAGTGTILEANASPTITRSGPSSSSLKRTMTQWRKSLPSMPNIPGFGASPSVSRKTRARPSIKQLQPLPPQLVMTTVSANRRSEDVGARKALEIGRDVVSEIGHGYDYGRISMGSSEDQGGGAMFDGYNHGNHGRSSVLHGGSQAPSSGASSGPASGSTSRSGGGSTSGVTRSKSAVVVGVGAAIGRSLSTVGMGLRGNQSSHHHGHASHGEVTDGFVGSGGEKPRRLPSVRDLAILPTQRVMRYVLLFRDLLAHTPPTSPSRAIVEKAVDAAIRVAQKCDRAQGNAAFLRVG